MERTNPSLWIETTPETSYPELQGEQRADVAIVGAGIVGITAAVLLARSGVDVVVVEAQRVCSSVSGYTTAKLTSQHTLIYDVLTRQVGEERARMYADAQETAIDRVRRFVDEFDIDCDLEEKPAYTHAESDRYVSMMQREVDAARKLGLKASFATEAPLPFPIAGAVRFDGQYQFHPRKYLLPLLEQAVAAGARVYENSRVTDVSTGSPCTVSTGTGTVTCDRIIMASHIPTIHRGMFYSKQSPNRSYAVCGELDPSLDPQGMYISLDSPTRSVRTARGPEGELLVIVSGNGHKTGEVVDTDEKYAWLADWGSEQFNVTNWRYRWSTQDFFPFDMIPFVGPVGEHFGGDRLLVATGFKGWGMTNGTAAAMMLAGLCMGQRSEWLDLFDATRNKPLFTPKFLVEHAKIAKHFVGDRLSGTDGDSIEEVAPGEGKIIDVDGDATAVFRDDDGAVHAVSPVCTHMGCRVHFNAGEKSWDCPCHGSRFGVDGTVINGPADKPLEQREVPASTTADA